jgi:hypothetical protein
MFDDYCTTQREHSAPEARSKSPPSSGEKGGKSTQSELLLTLVREAGVELWSTPAGDAYMSLPVDGHVEHHSLGKGARDWLRGVHYKSAGKPPSAQALDDALGVLRAEAIWDGECHEVHVRYAADGERTYLDLGDPEWRAVEISAQGWKIVTDAPIRFLRPPGLLPLPEPKAGGRLDGLRDLLNLDDDDWTLVCGWLVGTMAPAGPYPVLALHGEQGAAKSTAARLLCSLTDPNQAPLRSAPRSERDLMIWATNARVLALDNLSKLSDWLSDALCRLATGGGVATRKLYTDAEETILDATRPVIVTGIAEVASRGDLIDRMSVVTLKPISKDDRKTEAELDARWKEIQPLALGGLLDATVIALRRLPETRPERLPRLAGHARFVAAAEAGLGWPDGTYIRVYDRSRSEAFEAALDASPITGRLRALGGSGFDGTPTELYELLAKGVDESVTRRSAWPANARALSAELRRLAPSLREAGIEIDFMDTARPRRIVLGTATEPSDGSDEKDPADASDANQHDLSGPNVLDGDAASRDSRPESATRILVERIMQPDEPAPQPSLHEE